MHDAAAAVLQELQPTTMENYEWFAAFLAAHFHVLPAEVFADAGVAWTKDNRPSFAGGDREWVRSAGVAVRANLLGYAIAELAYVRPFDRSRRGWVWQFGLMPGF